MRGVPSTRDQRVPAKLPSSCSGGPARLQRLPRNPSTESRGETDGSAYEAPPGKRNVRYLPCGDGRTVRLRTRPRRWANRRRLYGMSPSARFPEPEDADDLFSWCVRELPYRQGKQSLPESIMLASGLPCGNPRIQLRPALLTALTRRCWSNLPFGGQHLW